MKLEKCISSFNNCTCYNDWNNYEKKFDNELAKTIVPYENI